MTLISITSGCYNEEDNVEELCERVKAVFSKLPEYDYEQIIIDNCSTDSTVAVLKKIAEGDKRVKVILNTRNFGPERSGFHALLQARGDAVIAMASDLQDPPELIPDFLEKWKEGFNVVLAVKRHTADSFGMRLLRSAYYRIVSSIADVDLVKDATGFGLYDKTFMEQVQHFDDQTLYVRGLISELGLSFAAIPFDKPARRRGVSKNNFLSLFDTAMLGITSHSKLPLRLATFSGFVIAILSMLVSLVYLIYKFMHWYDFDAGVAPLVIGLFFFSAVQLFFIGIVGEYVSTIHSHVLKRPRVVEKERINFE